MISYSNLQNSHWPSYVGASPCLIMIIIYESDFNLTKVSWKENVSRTENALWPILR
jgi:hypothetical protein